MSLLLLFNQGLVGEELDIKNPQIEATNYDNQTKINNYGYKIESTNYDYQIDWKG